MTAKSQKLRNLERGMRPRKGLRLLCVFSLIYGLPYAYNHQQVYAEATESTAQTVHQPDEVPLGDAADLRNKSQECKTKYQHFIREPGQIYCNAIFDQYLCWPPTLAGSNTSQRCPTDVLYVSTKNFATRRCGPDGLWLDYNRVGSETGWTDYIKCFPAYLQEFIENITKSKDFDGTPTPPQTTTVATYIQPEQAHLETPLTSTALTIYKKTKKVPPTTAMTVCEGPREVNASKVDIAMWVRGIEIVGTSISNVALIGALGVFKKFTVLRNFRTRVHIHLFQVLLTQGMLTLFVHTDQITFRILNLENNLCKVVYTGVELLTSNSFCFMFVEGLTIYSCVNAKSLRPTVSFKACLVFAYFFPLLKLIVWIVIAADRYRNVWCWFGYNVDSLYWILQAPRLTIVIINICLLVGVIRILMTKMNKSKTTEVNRLWKALHATAILMPLLGITNFLSMTKPPVRDTSLEFAFWAFFAYVFKSFQGLLISFLFCYRNAEVREALQNYMRARQRKNTLHSSMRAQANVTETDIEMLRRDGEPSRLTSLTPDTPEECPARLEAGEAQDSEMIALGELETENNTVAEVSVEVHYNPQDDEEEETEI